MAGTLRCEALPWLFLELGLFITALNPFLFILIKQIKCKMITDCLNLWIKKNAVDYCNSLIVIFWNTFIHPFHFAADYWVICIQEDFSHLIWVDDFITGKMEMTSQSPACTRLEKCVTGSQITFKTLLACELSTEVVCKVALPQWPHCRCLAGFLHKTLEWIISGTLSLVLHCVNQIIFFFLS